MKNTLLFIALFHAGLITAQRREPLKVSPEIIESIRQDVWQPFMESYRDLDSEKLKNIHSKDILRITVDQNQIETGTEYLTGFGQFLERVKQMKRQVAIAFSVQSTAVKDDIAYQTGYYRFSSKGADDASFQARGYGYFNVVLRKEAGVWKISMDSDKSVEITEEKFKDSELLYDLYE